jgi:hypothetical protein
MSEAEMQELQNRVVEGIQDRSHVDKSLGC